jgi:thymidylate synthase, flavin-dependent|nr:MAG TPA: FAD-dependent thymidylate synthase [Caudoviricetes sp.]
MFKVKLLSYTPLEVINTAIRTCWDSHDKSDNLGEKDLDLIKRVVLQNFHESVCEHCVFNFFIQGISRLNLMELTRHRLASYSVKSTRYTLKELRNETEFTIKDKERASKYINLTDNNNVDECSIQALENVRRLVNNAVNYNVTQDLIKYALPECYKTDLTFSINVRSLRNLLKLRTSKSAHFEIRNLAYKLYEALPEEFKFLFKDVIE